jgi:hypothetical protein
MPAEQTRRKFPVTDDRDIDTDPTLEIGALHEARLRATDLQFTLGDATPPRSELSYDLRAKLLRLTPLAPSERRRKWVLPVVCGPVPHAATRRTPSRATTAVAIAGLLRVARGAVEMFAGASLRLASSLGQAIWRLAAEFFARARRALAVAMGHVPHANWWGLAMAQARTWKRHLLGGRPLSRR